MRLRSWISISRNIEHWSLDYFYYLLDRPLPELAGKGYYYPCREYHEPIASWVKHYAAIDMMDCDDNSLYFLTAKGKGFYDRLIRRQFLAFTAMKGEYLH